MPLIKRYPNRKLYDTQSKSYIKLDEIAELIRRGEDVRVIDHASGDDLTTLTLTQIVLEEEKRQSGFLPLHLLSNLVRAGGATVAGLQKALAGSPAGMSHIDEEIQRRLDSLVRSGDLTADEAHQLMMKFMKVNNNEPEVEKGQDEIVRKLLIERGVPTLAEIHHLNDQLDALMAMIDDLERS